MPCYRIHVFASRFSHLSFYGRRRYESDSGHLGRHPVRSLILWYESVMNQSRRVKKCDHDDDAIGMAMPSPTTYSVVAFWVSAKLSSSFANSGVWRNHKPKSSTHDDVVKEVRMVYDTGQYILTNADVCMTFRNEMARSKLCEDACPNLFW